MRGDPELQMMRWKHALVIVGTAALAGACAPQGVDSQRGAVTDTVPDVVADTLAGTLADTVPERAAAPDADSLLPPLPGYTTDDDAEPGEVESSLDHGSVPYEEVRRRIVLDEQGYTSGAVTVITFRPDSAAAGQILDHIYGAASRSSVHVEGEEMIRIDAEPFAVIAWVGPGFVVTFGRGQARSDEWLEELVRSTVRAVAGGAG